MPISHEEARFMKAVTDFMIELLKGKNTQLKSANPGGGAAELSNPQTASGTRFDPAKYTHLRSHPASRPDQKDEGEGNVQ